MSKRWVQVLMLLAILFAAAQVIRPNRTNPQTDPARTIRAHLGASNAAVAVIERSCNDCHSNETVWPSYAQIAPVSWLMAYEVREGRKAVNFSEWVGYPPERKQKLLVESCQDASNGKMPGPYTLVRPEVRLSAQDVETICTAARRSEADTAGGF